MKRIFILPIAILMAFILAACSGNADKTSSGSTSPSSARPGSTESLGGSQPQAGELSNGWFSEANLSAVGLSGLVQPAGTTIKDSSDTNVKLSDMTDEHYREWVAGAFALISEKNGGVYEAETDDSFKLVGYRKIPSLTAADVSTDELPSFDLVYQMGERVYSLYILYYPVAYRGESAGYAEVRIADMTSEWGSLPFGD